MVLSPPPLKHLVGCLAHRTQIFLLITKFIKKTYSLVFYHKRKGESKKKKNSTIPIKMEL